MRIRHIHAKDGEHIVVHRHRRYRNNNNNDSDSWEILRNLPKYLKICGKVFLIGLIISNFEFILPIVIFVIFGYFLLFVLLLKK